MDASGFETGHLIMTVHKRGNNPLLTYQQERTSQDGWQYY